MFYRSSSKNDIVIVSVLIQSIYFGTLHVVLSFGSSAIPGSTDAPEAGRAEQPIPDLQERKANLICDEELLGMVSCF